MKKQSTIELQALLVGATIYLIMGICGWITYYLSHSDALLLDGNYNLINGITSFIGYFVVKIRSSKTQTFPFGQFIYESLYSLVKGIFVLGILVASLWENTVKIIDYFVSNTTHEINTTPIGIYTILMVSLSFGLASYYKHQNKKIDKQSSMLKTDSTTATIDGLLSLFAGSGLLIMIAIGKNIENLRFLQYIGDSIIVLLFVLFAIKEPFHIIKHSFIELAGGQLQSKLDRHIIKDFIYNQPHNFNIKGTYISKTGSHYLILIYIDQELINNKEIQNYRDTLHTKMSKSYPNYQIEMILNELSNLSSNSTQAHLSNT